ncbi:NitT/TauT family transport system permease protein [Devosia enhydra]|uniref:NitT/TauT family transport system permease protein n=1 Tax=Devosia enhydra TaxID=665118 RepID=A0A1K2HYN1_9HYPH|nr:ABC transporter permease [Devosia enhydra]SFZ84748.1 NitT/TauT family transport system permease protein [Devosia enhydra]
MTRLSTLLTLAAALLLGAIIVLPFVTTDGWVRQSWDYSPVISFCLVSLIFIFWYRHRLPAAIPGTLATVGGLILLSILPGIEAARAGFWAMLASVWVLAWLFAERLSADLRAKAAPSPVLGALIPIAFGAVILLVWEAGTRGGNVSPVLLPPPSGIGTAILDNTSRLWADFQQTFLRAVLIGYAIGCGSAFIVAILVDRSPFLRRGLLPLGNFVSALPIVGIAPILVMWFGFDWHSKAAVVVAMTFFPMLVNTLAGLEATSAIERDLMRTYAASPWQSLLKLRLPAAAPFIFNALKINSTLALIGAIVAEFFGSPVVGMGFRMSSEIGKLNLPLVWAEIAVAALAGSLFYFVIALVERAVTFWHPSVRRGRA